LVKLAVAFLVLSFLQTATAQLPLMAVADVLVRVSDRARHTTTAEVLAAGDQLFDFPVQQLI
jgi:hypothetical protein